MNIIQMSTSAGILILMIAAVRVIAKNKLSGKVYVILWGIALLRLVIPFSIPTRYNIYSLINSINEVFRVNAAMIGGLKPDNIIEFSTGQFNVAYGTVNAEPLMMAWIIGTLVMAVFFLIMYFKSHNKISTALPIKNNTFIEMWLRDQKIKRPLKIMVSDQITTPLACGILKPRIVLPKSLDFADEQQLRYILTHELIHVKNFDALFKLLMLAALCIHWFNPAIWILYRLLNRDLELACDEKVIKVLGEDIKSSYALSLIGLAEKRISLTPLFSSFSKNATEERIVSIMKYKKRTVFSFILAFILIASASSVFSESIKGLRVYGIFKTENGVYSIKVDEDGSVEVRDSNGKVINTTTVNEDGDVVLKDENGEIINIFKLENKLKAGNGKRVMLYNKHSLSEINRIMFNNNGIHNEYKAEFYGNSLIVKDTNDKAIGSRAYNGEGQAR